VTGTMAVLDETGDVKTVWDSENETEVAAARKQFDDLKAKGFLAYKVDRKGEKGEVIRRFDPDAEAIILAPPMVGG
jgi:hypothetical protein